MHSSWRSRCVCLTVYSWEVKASNSPLPCSSGAWPLHEVSRLVVAQETCSSPTPSRCKELVEYHVPLEKACLPAPPYFPQGLIMDPSILIQPTSPTTLFKFPVDMPTMIQTMNVGGAFCHSTAMDSVRWVVGLPRVMAYKVMKDCLNMSWEQQ